MKTKPSLAEIIMTNGHIIKYLSNKQNNMKKTANLIPQKLEHHTAM